MRVIIDFWNNDMFRAIILTLLPIATFYLLYKAFTLGEDKKFDKKEAVAAAMFLTPIFMIIIGGVIGLLFTIICEK